MIYKTAKPWIMTSVKLSPEFYSLCKKHGIKITEAVRVGISLMLAERGEIEYDTNLNLFRKINQLREKLENTSKELEELKIKNG